MRESNFAFPAQNKACVCITSQLYDRRALDTTAALPLFNSLTHLTYLTSTSPRIREIMTMDGGLERLVRILHEFCLCPPPPENPAILYGLTPPTTHQPKPTPALNPPTFDKHAAYRFSLAFQCIVNIGVRGSEPIRSRVVQAGTLDVVGCILEAWLANKGFAVGPSVSATGMVPRETREQRQLRRMTQVEARQRDEAAALQRALQRQLQVEQMQHRRVREAERMGISFDPEDESMDFSPSSTAHILLLSDQPSSDTDVSTDNSIAATPQGSGTPTGSVVIPSRDRSGTIIARPIWDQAPTTRVRRHRELPPESPSPSTSASRADTETEDDGDIDMDRSPERRHGRRAVGIVSDEPTAGPQTLQVGDVHIIINDAGDVGDGGVVEDGIVSLEPNDDFAMGAPPGAPGALEGTTPRMLRNAAEAAPDVTPRAGVVGLPMVQGHHHQRTATIRGRPVVADNIDTTTTTTTTTAARPSSSAHHRDTDSGPYRDEDVLLSLQLLAYLSKYPHVRQAFYKPRVTFHPASVNLPGARFGVGVSVVAREKREKEKEKDKDKAEKTTTAKEGLLRTFANAATGSSSSSRGKDRTIEPSSTSTASTSKPQPPIGNGAPSSARQTNVFSLVERFTFKPSSTETDLPNPPPRLPSEIQYWAGVIMRNACRKDDSRGGIRQCANMMCGKWETYPREFAKCRRCRKAKYCGKECQSTAWSEGHRFWCSAKDVEEDTLGDHSQSAQSSAATTNAVNTPSTETPPPSAGGSVHIAVEGGGGVEGRDRPPVVARPERERERTERERERERRRASRFDAGAGGSGDSDTGTVRTLHPHPHRPGMVPPLPPSSAGGSSTTSYVNPTTRAESGMSRDRTIQPHHQQLQQGGSASASASSSRVRPTTTTATREVAMPSTTRSQHQFHQEPTSTNYLTFHVQSTAGHGSSEAGRRRAETITAAGVGSSSNSASMSRRTVGPSVVVEVPPNVIPPRLPPTSSATSSSSSPMTTSSTATMTTTIGAGIRMSVSPTTTFNPDWPMAGSPGVNAVGGSRRHHHRDHHRDPRNHHAHANVNVNVNAHHHRISNAPTVRPHLQPQPQSQPYVEDEEDDMVLG
ncbi:hypothetical protein M413DRAFT_277406 [Hebeloma cylindrosporum]|uniref:MYND-type domain-containing protein n=1 Tax=Hebeloma cylindrosporum TaxID=76867 RepID=A0A0C2XHI0_HEBCY|nr:hypothetical protein M413DRAFT_277406 [Hebeloma cylindrosporum h7]